METRVRKQIKKINKTCKTNYTFSSGNGPPCPSLWKHLSLSWMGSNGSMEMDMEERECGWFERQRSQSIHGKHNNRQREKLFESDPPPSFYSFCKGF